MADGRIGQNGQSVLQPVGMVGRVGTEPVPIPCLVTGVNPATMDPAQSHKLVKILDHNVKVLEK